MMNKFNHDDEQNIEQYQQLLDLSSQKLKPNIQARLNANRRSAVDNLQSVDNCQPKPWRFVISMAIPIMLAVYIIFPLTSEPPVATTDLYADLELLMDEEELDFLAEMEVSEWLIDENDG